MCEDMNIRSEDEFLKLVDKFFPKEHEHLILGRGDDCAIIRSSPELCISSDLFLENIHFKKDYFSAADIGYKALAVNISDIAAMGGVPLGFSLNLMVPDYLDESFLSPFFQGMSILAKEYSLVLAGGDLSQAPILGVDITIWGSGKGRFMQRQKCIPGDYLFLIGEIGMARAGLFVLEQGIEKESFFRSIKAHLRPKTYVAEGQILATQYKVKGLMDVSDGLVRDLPRFLGSKYGANIDMQEVDLDMEVCRYARLRGISPIEFALLGGEDYSLLGAVAAEGWEQLKEKIPQIYSIGQVISKPGIFVDNKPFVVQGFDHFGR